MEDWQFKFVVVVAAIVVLILGCVFLLWGLPNLRAAGGIAAAIAAGGLAPITAQSPWLLPGLSIVLTAGVGSVAAAGAVKAVAVARAKPYHFLLPVLSAFGGFAVDLAETYPFEGVTGLLYGLFTALLLVGAGILFVRPGRWAKVAAVGCALLSPAYIVLAAIHEQPANSFTWAAVPDHTKSALLLVVLVVILVCILAFMFRSSSSAPESSG